MSKKDYIFMIVFSSIFIAMFGLHAPIIKHKECILKDGMIILVEGRKFLITEVKEGIKHD